MMILALTIAATVVAYATVALAAFVLGYHYCLRRLRAHLEEFAQWPERPTTP